MSAEAHENACSGVSMSAEAHEKANAAPRVPSATLATEISFQPPRRGETAWPGRSEPWPYCRCAIEFHRDHPINGVDTGEWSPGRVGLSKVQVVATLVAPLTHGGAVQRQGGGLAGIIPPGGRQHRGKSCRVVGHRRLASPFAKRNFRKAETVGAECKA